MHSHLKVLKREGTKIYQELNVNVYSVAREKWKMSSINLLMLLMMFIFNLNYSIIVCSQWHFICYTICSVLPFTCVIYVLFCVPIRNRVPMVNKKSITLKNTRALASQWPLVPIIVQSLKSLTGNGEVSIYVGRNAPKHTKIFSLLFFWNHCILLHKQ